MKLTINGKTQDAAEGSSIQSLLLSLNLKEGGVVVEVNREIIERKEYGSTILVENDQLELITIVGGG